MEAWELDAREQIRDLVAAYNAHGDRGRFDELLALFANGASMDIGDGATYEGVDAIRSIFTDTRDSVVDADGPKFLQHHISGLLPILLSLMVVTFVNLKWIRKLEKLKYKKLISKFDWNVMIEVYDKLFEGYLVN